MRVQNLHNSTVSLVRRFYLFSRATQQCKSLATPDGTVQLASQNRDTPLYPTECVSRFPNGDTVPLSKQFQPRWFCCMATTTGEGPPHLRLMVRSGRHEQERFVAVHGRTTTMSVLAVGEALSVRCPNNTALTFCLLAQTTTVHTYHCSRHVCLLHGTTTRTHTRLGTVITVLYSSMQEKMPCRLYKDNDGGVVVVDSEAWIPMF